MDFASMYLCERKSYLTVKLANKSVHALHISHMQNTVATLNVKIILNIKRYMDKE